MLRAICCSPDIHKLPDISQPTCSWVGPCDQFCWVSCELKWHVAEELGAGVPSSSFLFYSCSHGGHMLRKQNHRLEEPGCWVSTWRTAVFRELREQLSLESCLVVCACQGNKHLFCLATEIQEISLPQDNLVQQFSNIWVSGPL